MQFLLLGAAFFVVAHLVEAHRQSADRTILVDDGVVHRLSQLYEMQMGSQPSAARIDGMIEDYVHDEVLYREAVKAGLDQDDEIVRRRLIQKLEFLNRDLLVAAEPTETQLRTFYGQHRNLFTEPAKVSFSHAYFSPDSGGEEAARFRAEQALAALETAPGSAADVGDRFPLQRDYTGLSRLDTVQLFGQTDIVETLYTAPTGRWLGPVRSGYGWHLVFVRSRSDDAVAPFDQVRTQVREAYLEDARQRNNREQYAGLRQHYTVVVRTGVVRTDSARVPR